jgi:V-type H+-transporting ATPase subunit E
MSHNQNQSIEENNIKAIINYIEGETEKKLQMIRKDAEKEAELDKKNFVRPEKQKIAKKIEKELEDYKTKMKIAQSQKMNKLRLEKLKTKIDCVNYVFEEAKKQLTNTIKNNPEQYKKILKDLLIQGFIRLLDDKINVLCKKDDFELVKSLIDEAKNDFLEKMKIEAKKSVQINNFSVTLDEKYFLPETM